MIRRTAAAALVAVAAALSLASSSSATPPAGYRLGTVSIPAIGISFPLFEGELQMCDGREAQTLERGVSHYPCSALPWEIGTVMFAGHRTTHVAPFRRLNELKSGDVIKVRTRKGTFTYRVARTKIVSPHTSFNPEIPRRLLLSTCYPAGSDAFRLVVFAKLAKGPER